MCARNLGEGRSNVARGVRKAITVELGGIAGRVSRDERMGRGSSEVGKQTNACARVVAYGSMGGMPKGRHLRDFEGLSRVVAKLLGVKQNFEDART